jgi:hypothetical protein
MKKRFNGPLKALAEKRKNEKESKKEKESGESGGTK